MDSRPPLWKQLLGAAVGATVALLLYEAYKVSAPMVTAWLVAPQSQIAAEHPGAVRANQEVSEYEFSRLAARAKEIYWQFAAEPGPRAAVMRKAIEVTQPVPQNSSSATFVDLTEQTSSSSSSEIALSSSSVPPSVEMSSSSSFPARTLVAAQHTTKLVGKKLPQSGVEVTLAVMLALGMTGMLRKRPSTSLPSTSLRAGRTGRTK